jgi:hypothetical protein
MEPSFVGGFDECVLRVGDPRSPTIAVPIAQTMTELIVSKPSRRHRLIVGHPRMMLAPA